MEKKLNTHSRTRNKGVSAIIGVILMVAITIAIAVTTYVYVSGMMGGGVQNEDWIVGQKADDFTIRMIDGSYFTLYDYDNPVLIHFFQLSCKGCKENIPDYNYIYNSTEDKKIKMIMISVFGGDSLGALNTFKEDYDIQMDVGVNTKDYDFNKMYGVYGVPATMLIRKDKVVEYFSVGSFDKWEVKQSLSRAYKVT